MAGSSSDPLPFMLDELSLALARQLQEEDDAVMAAQLIADDARSATAAKEQRGQPSSLTSTPSAGRAPHLASPAHKVCQHLGRQTCKKISEHFLKQNTPMTLGELLGIFRSSKQRETLLMMVDAGQRERVEAELVALDFDFAQ